VPGLKVIAPYSAMDAKALLKAAVRDPNPVIFLENEILYGRSFEVADDEVVEIGKARICKKGSDVTIVSYSIQVGNALEAAQVLESNNISAEVIDLRTLRPLDIETVIKSVQKTNRLIIVEEGWSIASISATISAMVVEQAFDYLDAPIVRINAKDVPLPYAANLEKLALPCTKDIIDAALAIVNKK
jgi:pyruvate dehydrogenase E1 component beta subunit